MDKMCYDTVAMAVTVQCDYCGKDVVKSPSLVREKVNFCSTDCCGKYRTGSKNHKWRGGLVDKKCMVCGEIYQVKKSHAGHRKTCSRKCGGVWKARIGKGRGRKRIAKQCVVCGDTIEVKVSHVDTEGTYCSMECMAHDYKTRITKENNPNWKGGMVIKSCLLCGKEIEAIPSRAEKKKFCSCSCSAIWRTMNTTPPYGKRSRSGKRADLNGLYVRSSWEANYARYLKWLVSIGEIKGWEFEAEEFEFPVKRGSRFYLPDFKVTNNDGSVEYHEVKGWMDKKSATKLKRMAKYYPEIKVVLIDGDAYHAIARQVKGFIPHWETRKRTP